MVEFDDRIQADLRMFAAGDKVLKSWKCSDLNCVHNNGLGKCKTPLARPGQETPVCGGRA